MHLCTASLKLLQYHLTMSLVTEVNGFRSTKRKAKYESNLLHLLCVDITHTQTAFRSESRHDIGNVDTCLLCSLCFTY